MLIAYVVTAVVLLVAFYPVDRENPDSWPTWYQALSGAVDARITPGLDLQGGLHLQYQVDVDAAIQDKILSFADDIRRIIRDEHPGVSARVTTIAGAPVIRVVAEGGVNPRTLIPDADIAGMNLIPSRESSGALRLELSSDYIERLRTDAVAQAIETIQRRIDDVGLAEPSIQPRGTTDIIIQMAGLDQARFDEVKELIETTAQLEFRLLSEQDASFWQTGFRMPEGATGVSMDGGYPMARELPALKQAMARVAVPEGTLIGYEEITEYDPRIRASAVVGYRARLMESYVWLTGDTVSDAREAIDPQTNAPIVSMQFDRTGARSMGRMTGENIGRAMVVVLDDIIVSIATIQGRITSRGQITMGSGGNYDETMAEVSRICVALRNGALVAPIEKQFETHVGPTLGAESVRRGALSLVIGFGAVFVFVGIWYRGAGIVANVALLSNLAFIFAILAYFKATLTLPGMAGITLTIGMAVDANVIIFERIKEELRMGRDARAAIEAGYAKAFSAIVDANLTSGIAALVLYQYGSGPVRGFALTLLIGIVCSLFSAIVITRLLFELALDKFKMKRLSIG